MASYGGFAGLIRRRQNPGGFGTMMKAGTAAQGGNAPSYSDIPGSRVLPGGNLRVSPGMGGTPRSIPGVEFPGTPDPGIANDPIYGDTLGLHNPQINNSTPKGPNYQYFVDPNGDNSGPGQNIPPNEDVPPPNNDFYYSGDPRFTMPDPPAPRATPALDWVNVATNTDSRGYPIPGLGGAPAGDWQQNARSGYPTPGVGTAPAGNWRQNATRTPVGRGSFGSFGVLGRGSTGAYGSGTNFGQGVGDFGINSNGNWGQLSWSPGAYSQAMLGLGIDSGAMMYRGHLAS